MKTKNKLIKKLDKIPQIKEVMLIKKYHSKKYYPPKEYHPKMYHPPEKYHPKKYHPPEKDIDMKKKAILVLEKKSRLRGSIENMPKNIM